MERVTDIYFQQIVKVKNDAIESIYDIIASTGSNQYNSPDKPWVTLWSCRQSWTDRLVSITIDADDPVLKEITSIQLEKTGSISPNKIASAEDWVRILEEMLIYREIERL